MIEIVFRWLGRFFHNIGTFFAVRATVREKVKMEAKYVGRHVRVTCGQKHYGRVLGGVWYVKSYDVDDGALKIFRGDACDIDSSNWVKPECVEVIS